MPKRICFLVLALVVGLPFWLSGCAAKKSLALGDAPKDPALVQGVLPNGFQYLLMENTTPKDRVSLHLIVFSGSAHETDEEQGVAHFLEHMLFNGSEHFKPGELVRYFQSIGMDFGADANARTSFFSTIYDLSLPKGDQEHLEDALLVMGDYAQGALLLEAELERERGVIQAEKRERDSVSYRSFKKELAFELPGSILPRRLPIGTDKVLASADRNLLKGFYDRHYRPDNMALVVVGDFKMDQALVLVQRAFSKLSPRAAGPLTSPDISWQPHSGVKGFYLHEPEAGSTQITIERIVQEPLRPDSEDRIKERAVQLLADLMLENRLSRMMREGTADFTSAGAYSGTYLRQVNMAAVQVSCDPAKWETSLVQLENSLRQALLFGFQAQELDRARSDYLASLESDLAGASTRKSEVLAEQIMNAVTQQRLFLSPQQTLDLVKPYLQGLTLEAVNRAFRETWQEDHRLVLVSGNAVLPDPGEEKILLIHESARKRPLLPYKDAEAKAFPYLPLPETRAAPVRTVEDAGGLGIDQIDFSNHVRLNLKVTPFNKGEFSFKAVFGSGLLSLPPSLFGLGELAESAVQESGLGQMDPDQLGNALAGREASIQFKLDERHCSLEGTASPKETELVFQLIQTYLTDPGFRPQGLSLAKTRFRQNFDALSRTPEGIMAIAGSRFLAGGDERFGLKPPDQADQVSLETIEQWLRPEFESGPLEVSLVGDFDPDQVREIAGKYLGALAPRNRPEAGSPMLAPPVFPQGQTLTLNLDTKIDSAAVRVAFLTDDFYDIVQTRNLSVLARVFSERLRLKIREALGASYSPYVYNQGSLTRRDYGVMQAVVNVAPKSSDLILDQIRQIVNDLALKGVSDEELSLVKPPILTHLKVLRQSNAYWLNSVMADSFRHPQRLDWAGHLVEGYQEVSAETLSKLARQYLDLKGMALIQILPN